ncbi:hypothetical protein K505DRAFT_413252 [Melanomma pulvis-pyrius CBS 109.77]|uniref:Uncharacterized protein n=1 Tax=Melanomma pulvis-pyrius CBS 109.77 TaxID=1314802 RepID=A0A6A6XTX8_9PLEO|nr:hypothetical protein K505DRAFT_413252 [Melanomma pulvis-pyrius CBS 109.77]
MACLEDLSDKILSIIFQFHFRLLSWRLKDFTDSQLYKNVTVGDDEDLIDATNRFVECLMNHTDNRSRYVRNFTVASFKGDSSSSCLNTDVFVKLIERFQAPAQFSWNVDTPMAKEILDAFHTHRPNARLCVKTNVFDSVLLSSPQLYRLDFTVACQERFTTNTISLFRRLKNVLVQSRSLRILWLDIYRMPPLEELTIEARDYSFDSDHYYQWLECMDWKKLRRLSFGFHRPGDFFAGLVNQTPKLQSLKFGYSSDSVVKAPTPEPHEQFIAECQSTGEFIKSLGSLKELAVQCHTMDHGQDLWEIIAEKHEKSLWRLGIGSWCILSENIITYKQLNLLYSHFTCLTHLDIDLTLGYKNGFASLGHLKVSAMCRDREDDVLVSKPESPHDLLSELWDAFFDHDPTSELVTITLRFWRWAVNHREGPSGVKKHIFYAGGKPNDEFKILFHGKSDKVNVYDVRFPHCDSIF